MIRQVLLTGALLTAGTFADTLPQDVADAYGAKCLNGSPPAYELFRNTSSNKWVLFLEGGFGSLVCIS